MLLVEKDSADLKTVKLIGLVLLKIRGELECKFKHLNSSREDCNHQGWSDLLSQLLKSRFKELLDITTIIKFSKTRWEKDIAKIFGSAIGNRQFLDLHYFLRSIFIVTERFAHAIWGITMYFILLLNEALGDATRMEG